jgi:NADP-dependent 3-hydroxy acid dehydrogenase YdfG
MPVALITGSNRGVGFGIASVLNSAGFKLISLNRTLAGCGWLGEIQCDLFDRTELEATLRDLQGGVSSLDACILNAGVRRLASAVEIRVDDIHESLLVNCLSGFTVAKAMHKALKRASGTIVFIGSNAARRAFEGGTAYCSSKAAMATVAEVLELEWGPLGVRVTTVTAGAVMNRAKSFDEYKLTPEEVGTVVLALLRLPSNVRVPRIELEPSRSVAPHVTGINRLLYRGS